MDESKSLTLSNAIINLNLISSVYKIKMVFCFQDDSDLHTKKYSSDRVFFLKCEAEGRKYRIDQLQILATPK